MGLRNTREKFVAFKTPNEVENVGSQHVEEVAQPNTAENLSASDIITRIEMNKMMKEVNGKLLMTQTR